MATSFPRTAFCKMRDGQLLVARPTDPSHLYLLRGVAWRRVAWFWLMGIAAASSSSSATNQHHHQHHSRTPPPPCNKCPVVRRGGAIARAPRHFVDVVDVIDVQSVCDIVPTDPVAAQKTEPDGLLSEPPLGGSGGLATGGTNQAYTSYAESRIACEVSALPHMPSLSLSDSRVLGRGPSDF